MSRSTVLLVTACSLGLLAVLVMLVSPFASVPEETATEPDSIAIDSNTYPIPEKWHGAYIDSTLWANPETLVRLPDSMTFEDYRIYVTPATRDAFLAMAAAAGEDSVKLIADSGYRSPGFQLRIIKRRLADGQDIERILRDVAPPGYSQHHTGRALDLVPSEARFAFEPAYRWLQENAATYGFFETYPDDTTSPHPWESWHWMYVGR